jgi:copper(I)-binding protein
MTFHSNFLLRIFRQSLYLVLRRSMLTLTTVCLLILSITVSANNNVHAQNIPLEMATSVSINDAWARATFALAKTGAAYLSVTNSASQTVVLKSVSVEQSIAMIAQLHHTVMENDMMRMQELEDGIRIKAGATVELSPGGMHIMVMGLQKPLNKDDSIEITLHFEDGSQLIQNFPILDKRN